VTIFTWKIAHFWRQSAKSLPILVGPFLPQ
jgi:hypothetical protein